MVSRRIRDGMRRLTARAMPPRTLDRVLSSPYVYAHDPRQGGPSMVRITVLYPNETGKKFDHDYYVNRHMKLVRDRLGKFGLVRTEVDRGQAGGAPGSVAPFIALGHVYFNRLEDFQKGMAEHGAEIMADIPSYTNIQPQIQISEMIA
jgi:uncharacterized protein (TIGR02118 family)